MPANSRSFVAKQREISAVVSDARELDAAKEAVLQKLRQHYSAPPASAEAGPRRPAAVHTSELSTMTLATVASMFGPHNSWRRAQALGEAMATPNDVLAAIEHVKECTGDQKAWLAGLTPQDVADAATIFATSPRRLDGLIAGSANSIQTFRPEDRGDDLPAPTGPAGRRPANPQPDDLPPIIRKAMPPTRSGMRKRP